MVKKITIYTAFGQFLNMVEKQMELEVREAEPIKTDEYPIEHPLSDYQNALNSVHSCPANFTASIPPVAPIAKSTSCPLVSFHFHSRPSDPIPSPVPTSIESRKLNEATDLMMSFWKVHVTVRKPRDAEEHAQLPSIFEKMEGLFGPSTSTSAVSLFEKFEGFFEKTEEKKEKTEDIMSWVDTWNSFDYQGVPQLPVFVKSPVDSLKLYQGPTTGELADDELSNPSSSPVEEQDDILKRIRVQNMFIEEQQKKIIRGLARIQTVIEKLTQQQQPKDHQA